MSKTRQGWYAELQGLDPNTEDRQPAESDIRTETLAQTDIQHMNRPVFVGTSGLNICRAGEGEWEQVSVGDS